MKKSPASVSRRQFLGRAALGASALGLSGYTGGLPVLAGRPFFQP